MGVTWKVPNSAWEPQRRELLRDLTIGAWRMTAICAVLAIATLVFFNLIAMPGPNGPRFATRVGYLVAGIVSLHGVLSWVLPASLLWQRERWWRVDHRGAPGFGDGPKPWKYVDGYAVVMSKAAAGFPAIVFVVKGGKRSKEFILPEDPRTAELLDRYLRRFTGPADFKEPVDAPDPPLPTPDWFNLLQFAVGVAFAVCLGMTARRLGWITPASQPVPGSPLGVTWIWFFSVANFNTLLAAVTLVTHWGRQRFALIMSLALMCGFLSFIAAILVAAWP